MRPPLRVGTVYDFRNTPESGMDMPGLYAAIIDQVVALDRLGLDLVWFTEHHFLDDGYLPSWVPMAGAIAARTKRVRISSDVCLLPFNHPVRLAEDLAVLDNISNGRIEIGAGTTRSTAATVSNTGSAVATGRAAVDGTPRPSAACAAPGWSTTFPNAAAAKTAARTALAAHNAAVMTQRGEAASAPGHRSTQRTAGRPGGSGGSGGRGRSWNGCGTVGG